MRLRPWVLSLAWASAACSAGQAPSAGQSEPGRSAEARHRLAGAPEVFAAPAPEPSGAAVPKDGARPDLESETAGPGAPEAGCVRADGLPVFVERGAAAGLDQAQSPPHDARFYTELGDTLNDTDSDAIRDALHFTGGGAAGDYDGDGYLDLFLTRVGFSSRLYRNRGDGTFEDDTDAAGLRSPDRFGNGAGWADLDNDGDLDLVVTSAGFGRLRMWINDGEGHFDESAAARGVTTPDDRLVMGQSVSFGDFDRDGYLDIHTGEWNSDAPPGQSMTRLYRNLGLASPGHFEDVTDRAGVKTAQDSGEDFAFTTHFADFDDDGYPDLAVAADFGDSRLFWNRGDGSFEDGTEAAGVALEGNAMGAAVGDYDGDGLLDWFVSSISWPRELGGALDSSGNRLYRYLGGRRFEDATDGAGVRTGYWGWGASFVDADNDADLDLVMTNGTTLVPGLPQFFSDPLRFWRNDCGVMDQSAAEAGVEDRGDGKGLLVFDYDNDGDQDLLVINHAARPLLYENRTPHAGAWLQLSLHGRTANSQGIGARVKVFFDDDRPPLVREVSASSNFLAQNPSRLHLGLGSDVQSIPRIEIVWPTPGERTTQVLTAVPTGMRLDVFEP